MDKINGKTEFDIFKNCYTMLEKIRIAFIINRAQLQSKDDVESERLRQLALKDFVAKKFRSSLNKFNESLRYATYNGRKYALVLGNRADTYFAIRNYENCLIDIGLSLEADYPINLKPRLLILKAKCLMKLGKIKQTFETIDDCCKQMQDNLNLPKNFKEKYLKEIKLLDLDIKQVDIEGLPLEETILKSEVILEQNHLNPNVSACVKIIYNRKTGIDYVAARNIPRGEVLFVDPAYSVGSTMLDSEKKTSTEVFFCDYCLSETKNCIPCKICINFVYCSEDCQNKSWTEYHEWECDIIRSNVASGDLCLPLRTLFKAAFSGEIFEILNDTEPDQPSAYLQIHNLHLDLASFRSKCPELFDKSCETAVFMVEFLDRTNFFTRLMSSSPRRESLSTLKNFIGGLFIRHILQGYKRSLSINSAALIVLESDKQEDSQLLIQRFYVFCPIVSGLKYSCESNTSLYFNKSTCIVKARRYIKAGTRIFRSGHFYTQMLPYNVRQKLLRRININCDCTACKNIDNNIDVFNSYICCNCDRYTLVEIYSEQLGVMRCNKCGWSTLSKYFVSKNNLSVLLTMDPDLKLMLATIKGVVNPFHQSMYDIYKGLLIMCSKQDDFKEFKEALQNFKTCTENRSGRFNAYEYITDLITICNLCFDYLQLTESKLQKQEIMDVLDYFSAVVKEAKEIAEYTFPPFLLLFPLIELSILKFRVARIHLKDI